MKPNRGRLAALFLVLFSVLLHAEDFTYTIHPSTLTPYEKEPVLLSVDINQTNPEPILLFLFDIKPKRTYRVEQISATHDNTLHHAKEHYLYLLFPLKSGLLDIDFDLTKRVTNDDKVHYFFSGDRDDFKKLETTDSNIPVPPLRLQVKPLPKGTQLIGNFKLGYLFKPKKVEAYAPVSLRITIEGNGYPPLIKNIYPKQEGVSLFASKPVLTRHVDAHTVHYKAVYDLALTSGKSFDTAPITLRAFNPKTRKQYTLSIPSEHIEVTRPDTAALVDKTDTPPPLQTDWRQLSTLMGYLLAFGAGFLSAWLLKWHKKERVQEHPLTARIDASKTKKALLQLLMAEDVQRFAPVIDKLEADLYGTGNHALKQLKQEAKERLI